MITFVGSQSSFGRHETFPLRYGWLTRGFSAWQKNPRIFEEDGATVTLGVGKNMVNAIRYWLLAAQTVTTKNRELVATELGSLLFTEKGWDPFLEDDTTIWLIHWLIASNPTWATAPFWFFNRFYKPEFTSKELHEALTEFIEENCKSKASPSTVKHDSALLLRMYERSNESKMVPLEEALDSPVSMLELIEHQEGSRFHESKPKLRPRLPTAAFAFAVAELFEQLDVPSIPVERLLHSDGIVAAPGSVFRLTEEGLVAKIEKMIAWLPKQYELRSTAGLHQLYRLSETRSIDLLRQYYEPRSWSGS